MKEIIANATAEELNEMIAKAMGVCFHVFDDFRPIGFSHRGPNMCCVRCRKSLTYGEIEPNPKWASDWAAAGELLDSLNDGSGWMVNMNNSPTQEDHWRCDILAPGQSTTGQKHFWAESGPEAICRAYLFAAGGNKED